jgi:hypothetical protein
LQEGGLVLAPLLDVAVRLVLVRAPLQLRGGVERPCCEVGKPAGAVEPDWKAVAARALQRVAAIGE